MVSLPEPFHSMPRLPLLYTHASPIEPLYNLRSHLRQHEDVVGEIPKIWMKREDSNSGLAGGGNKLRKLEYILADAHTKGATVLVTTGGPQSNHMRQVAAAAARMGIKCHLIPRDVHHEYYGPGNVQLTDLMTAHRHDMVASREEVDVVAQLTMQKLRDDGEKPYWIPSGGSTHKLGGLGYARCAFEIAQQEQAKGVHFDAIIVACNSGSTLGGLIAGFALLKTGSLKKAHRPPRLLLGIDTSGNSPKELKKLVLDIALLTAKRIKDNPPSKDDFKVDGRWSGGAYGKLDAATLETIKLVASTEGIILDPVYTGKAFTGMLDWIKQGHGKENENWLFVHTGGTSVLSAYPELH